MHFRRTHYKHTIQKGHNYTKDSARWSIAALFPITHSCVFLAPSFEDLNAPHLICRIIRMQPTYEAPTLLVGVVRGSKLIPSQQNSRRVCV